MVISYFAGFLISIQSLTPFMIIPNGQELAQFLGGEGESAGGRLPNIILLDLILPGKEGFEILQDIKNETRLAAIPVIILTESNVDRSYVLGANMFVSCLAGFEDLVDVVQSIEQFWLSVVALPRH